MPTDDSESAGNTRRRFLGGALAGAVATALGGRAAGSTTGTTGTTDSGQELEIRCSSVHNLDSIGSEPVRVEFTDGSYVDASGGSPDVIGSPGRVVDRVVLTDDVIDADGDCDPGELATTFTDSSVTVGASERQISDPQVVTSVALYFADGTSQEVLARSEDTGIGDESENEGLFTTYRGEGEHAGKTIEAIHFALEAYGKVVHLRNRNVGAHLLGKRTAQERIYEVVGASQGDIEYEFTVDGPVETASLTDRIGSGGNDDVTDNGDGTWTVEGFTGNTGYGDAYAVNGAITSFQQIGGDGEYVLRETERRVTDRSYDDPRLLRIVAAESGEVSYEFTVDGLVWKVTNVGDPLKADDNDDLTDNGDGTWTVEGFTGNQGYGDTYVVAGDVTDFTRTGGDADFRIEVDGREVTPQELVGD